jgi:hypothetical protein
MARLVRRPQIQYDDEIRLRMRPGRANAQQPGGAKTPKNGSGEAGASPDREVVTAMGMYGRMGVGRGSKGDEIGVWGL